MRQLDELREQEGLSKAELARTIGKNPATLRRLFTAKVNPELKTVAALASVLNAEVKVVPCSRRSPKERRASLASAEQIDLDVQTPDDAGKSAPPQPRLGPD